MHGMLTSVLADQIVRERSRSYIDGRSRPVASPGLVRRPRPERRGSLRLARHLLVARRAS
jgi:hypothetical protein